MFGLNFDLALSCRKYGFGLQVQNLCFWNLVVDQEITVFVNVFTVLILEITFVVLESAA